MTLIVTWKQGYFSSPDTNNRDDNRLPKILEVSYHQGKTLKHPILSKRLSFQDDFHFPQPRVMAPLQTIKNSKWMSRLCEYLNSVSQSVKQIYLLTSNFKYVDVLLNWLISAVVRNSIPIKNILILSMDYQVHTVLQSRNFCSLLVPTSSLFSDQYKFAHPFDGVMMLRLALMRIINHFGYDVIMYDTDAVMLRNPQPLFDELSNEDIIGSVGTIPTDLFVDWNVTICIGVVLVRSTVRTGIYIS